MSKMFYNSPTSILKNYPGVIPRPQLHKRETEKRRAKGKEGRRGERIGGGCIMALWGDGRPRQ